MREYLRRMARERGEAGRDARTFFSKRRNFLPPTLPPFLPPSLLLHARVSYTLLLGEGGRIRVGFSRQK
jgi:hypothetical protein